MALKTAIGPIGGSVSAPRITVTVWDDAFATVDEDAAVAAAAIAVPSTIFAALPDDDPDVDELAGHAYAITFNYSPAELTPPDPPPVGELTIDYRMSYQAQPKYVYEAPECLGIYDTDGLVVGKSRLKVNVRKVGGVNRVIGMQVDPLPEVHSLDVVIPDTDVTASYREGVAALCGKFNDDTFMDYPAGTLQLVRFNAQKRTNDDWNLSFGFGAGEERTNVPFDGNDNTGTYAIITVASIPAYAITWTVDRDVPISGTNEVEKLADFVVVQRAWDLGDFDALGLSL